MARAVRRSALALDTWARLMGIHPLDFNQVHLPALTRVWHPWFQYPWQDVDKVSREDVAQAIADAEDQIHGHLDYRLLPQWEVDEWKNTTRPYHHDLVNLSATDVRGYRAAVQADWGEFISGGIEVKDIIAEVAIVWGAADAYGYKRTGTATVADLSALAAVTDADEVRIYYPGKGGDDTWEIRPVEVVIDQAADELMVTLRRELTVKEEVLEDMASSAVDGTDDTRFLDTVDIYWVRNDPGTQVSFLWEQVPGRCNCGSAICPRCQYTTQAGCLNLRSEPRNSIVTYEPAIWDSDDREFDATYWSVGRQPDLVRLYYRAGLRSPLVTRPGNDMGPEWASIVAQYASSFLTRGLAEDGQPYSRIAAYQEDLAYIEGAEQFSKYQLTEADLSGPFGTKRGALIAWKHVKREARGHAIIA